MVGTCEVYVASDMQQAWITKVMELVWLPMSLSNHIGRGPPPPTRCYGSTLGSLLRCVRLYSVPRWRREHTDVSTAAGR